VDGKQVYSSGFQKEFLQALFLSTII
jgi:hypothetical protein